MRFFFPSEVDGDTLPDSRRQGNALIEGRLDYHECMESPSEFNTRAIRLLNDAVALSKNRSGDKPELNHWMAVAKRQRLTWVDGLAFSIEKMRSTLVN